MTAAAASAGRRAALPALAVLLLLAAGALIFIGLRGPAPARTQAEKAHAIATGLRCPVCRDLSVADSPATLAQEMRSTIRRDVAAGKSAGEIRTEFVAAYGESILLTPPRRGVNLVVLALPALLFAGGLTAGSLAIRRWRSAGRDHAVPDGAALNRASVADTYRPRQTPRLSVADRRLLSTALAGPDEDLE